MSPDKNNWQDLASDLGLSFEIDPNAPELPPEPEPVFVVEQTVITSVTVETPAELDNESELSSEALEESSVGSSGNGLQEVGQPGENSEEARKRKRGRRRRRGRGENGPAENDAAESESETPELVGSAVGRGAIEMDSDEHEDAHHGGDHGHGPHDEEEFVLEDLTNLNVPIWTELIDSLYRPDR